MTSKYYDEGQALGATLGEILPGLTWGSVLDAVSDMVGVLNTDAQCVWVNKAFSDYTQRSQSECIGEFSYDLLHLDKLKNLVLDAQIEATTGICTDPYAMRKVRCCLSPIGLTGEGNSGFILVARDVTEVLLSEDDLQKAKEREMRARSKNEVFSSKLSCEFRTALTGIIGMTQFLKDTHLDYEQSDYTATLDSCSSNLLSLIDGLIDEGALEAKIEQYPEFNGTVADTLVATPEPRSERSLAGRKFLLAEDNVVNAKVVRKMLEGFGAIVDVAINGQMACDLIMSTQYDMVLMDCEMPVMDGYAATRQIRSSGNVSLPIVALTAHATDEAQQLCIEVGMNAYLSKPVRKETLRDVVTQTLTTCVGNAISA